MDKSVSLFTVYFDVPFWVGVYERRQNDSIQVCKVTFGAEPKDGEIYELMLKSWQKFRFSAPVQACVAEEKHHSPKRMHRLVQKQQQSLGVGTKAQQAIKQEQEQWKTARKALSRELSDAQKERKYEQHKAKRKEKHKGH